MDRVRRLHDCGPDIARRYHQQLDRLAKVLGDCNSLGKQRLLKFAENLFHLEVGFSDPGPLQSRGQHNNVGFIRVHTLKDPAQLAESVVVTDGDQDVSRTDAYSFSVDCLLMQKLEVLLHLVLGFGMLALVDAFGDVEDEEERYGEDDACDRRDALGEQVDDGGRKQNQMHRGQAEWNLHSADPDVGRHLPAALAGELETQHQHSKAVEGETPDHAEGVRFTQGIDISPAGQDREQLQRYNQVDDAIAGTETPMRLAEPIGEHTVFRDSVQHSIRTDDGS